MLCNLWTVEQIISKYVYYSLSVDSSSTSNIGENFILEELSENGVDNSYIKIDEIEKIAKGDVELMEGCASKRLSLDINTVGQYDEAEEMEKMMNSLKEEGEMLGEKKGIKKGTKQGANNEKKSIAKNLLNIGIPKESIMQATGLNEAQIARLV